MTTLPKVHCNSKVISEDKFSKLPNLPTSLLENVYQFLIEKFCVGNSLNKIKEMIQMKKRIQYRNAEPVKSP